MTVRWITADVFDGLAQIDDDSVDLVVTSPPFLALRSYLPADHPDKDKEIGSEKNPAAFIDTLLEVTAELRRVLAPHGSICVELGDTYSGSGGAGGDWIEGSGQRVYKRGSEIPDFSAMPQRKGAGWPEAKSLSMIPESYRWALAYGRNPFNTTQSPAGTWIARNVIRWVKPNPAVGRLGDKWRPATSDMVIACTSPNRYWDDIATRKPHVVDPNQRSLLSGLSPKREDGLADSGNWGSKGHPSGAPLLDWWEINPGGYTGAHYAVFTPDLVEPCVKAMCPERVCRECGKPSRRVLGIPEYVDANGDPVDPEAWSSGIASGLGAHSLKRSSATRVDTTVGWTDCGHDDWRQGVALDPFAGSGTTLHVADALGRNAIGIDIDERNKTLYEQRINERRFNELRQLALDI